MRRKFKSPSKPETKKQISMLAATHWHVCARPAALLVKAVLLASSCSITENSEVGRIHTQSPTAGNAPYARNVPDGSAAFSPPPSSNTRYCSFAANDTRPLRSASFDILFAPYSKDLTRLTPSRWTADEHYQRPCYARALANNGRQISGYQRGGPGGRQQSLDIHRTESEGSAA